MSVTDLTPTLASEEDAPTASGVTLASILFAGIVVWVAHLIVQAWLVGSVCARGGLWPFHLVTVVAVVAIAYTLQVSWRVAHPRTSSTRADAAALLGWLAVVINVFNLVLVVAEWSPVLFLDPCAVL